MEDTGIVKLISKEGKVFEVPFEVAKISQVVATTFDEVDEDDEDAVREIPLPNMKEVVLAKVIDYCTHFKEEPMNAIKAPLPSPKLDDLVQPWYVSFVKVEDGILFQMVTAANFLEIKPMLDLCCLEVAVRIKGKQPKELRAIFNISNDFTPEEEAEVREENRWVDSPSNPNN
eukprot:Nitzschia sp. Nitz4//scaffold76_size158648//58858//59583//NITZ4_002543-RA/size158648-augustus-gene-0.149-mRNA-1//-1//CDS//3329557836//1665//frame0